MSLLPHGGGLGPGATPPVALTVAGSDSGGGAGIQADLKTFHECGVFGTSAITALTAQNTRGVRGIQKADPGMVGRQIRAVAEDLAPAAVKSGMLADAAIVAEVAEALEETGLETYVLDPVMVAASGDPLLETEAVEALARELVPRATLVTPNLDEAALLLGTDRDALEGAEAMEEAAGRLVDRGAPAVLLKGGHLEGPEVVDVLHDGTRVRSWRRPRLDTPGAHGTGCTLSAAVAAFLARGAGLRGAVEEGLAFTRRALSAAPRLGAGSVPLNHWAGGEPEPGPAMAARPPRWLAAEVGEGVRRDSVAGRMELVLGWARRNVERETGGPFAAGVFRRGTGELVAAGVNRVVPERCSSAHAEVMALSAAQRRLGTHDLSGSGSGGGELELVASAEPCAMCVGAVHWSGVSRLVCGARGEDVAAAGFEEGPVAAGWAGALEEAGVEVLRHVGREAAARILEAYRDRGGPIYNPGRGRP